MTKQHEVAPTGQNPFDLLQGTLPSMKAARLRIVLFSFDGELGGGCLHCDGDCLAIYKNGFKRRVQHRPIKHEKTEA